MIDSSRLNMVIPIEKDEIPYSFEMDFGEDTFTFEIHYNAEYDFFTIDLYRDDELLVAGEKVVYGVPLFSLYPDLFPATIVPLDVTGQAQRVTYENLGETVFLYVQEGGT